MRRAFLKGAMASALATSWLALAGPVGAQDAQSFYDGEVIRWIVPYDPGGGYDEYSRLIAPYLEKYSGARVDIVNLPGAGGMRGANEIFNSPPDGLTIGIINGSAMVTNQLSDIEGANYRVGDYNFLGRVVADLRVLVTSTSSGIDSFEALLASDDTALLGATGLGGSTYVDGVIVGQAYGINQKVVHGFNSSTDVRQALLRGDIHGMWGSLGSALAGVEAGDFQIVVQSDRAGAEELPGVPSVFSFLDSEQAAENAEAMLTAWDALNAVGRPVAAPPDVPEERIAFLRDAFEQAMTDPELLEKAQSSERELSYASGADMARIAKESTEMSPEVKELFVKAIRGEI